MRSELLMGFFFVEFDGEAVGVGEEEETAAGVGVCAEGFVGDVVAVEVTEGVVEVVDFKGEVAEAGGFGVRGAWGRRGEGEELDDVGVA